jgi:hypothetical protein
LPFAGGLDMTTGNTDGFSRSAMMSEGYHSRSRRNANCAGFFSLQLWDRASAFPFKGDDALLIPAASLPAARAAVHDSYKSYKEEYRSRGMRPTRWAALEYSIFPKYSS